VIELQSAVERMIGGLKGDSSYRIAGTYSNRQLITILWHRGCQLLRGASLSIVSGHLTQPVFRGRRVVIEHAYALWSERGLILEDDVSINALSRDGIRLGRNVTIARRAMLLCTGVVAEMGVGIRIGDRSAVGAGSFLGGQGGIVIGDDVIMGPGVRIFSENHRFADVARPIRAQGTVRESVTIGDDCWIGAGATIVAGVVIGSGCVVAAGAVVTASLPAFSVAAGVPARVVRSRRPEEVRPQESSAQRQPSFPAPQRMTSPLGNVHPEAR